MTKCDMGGGGLKNGPFWSDILFAWSLTGDILVFHLSAPPHLVCINHRQGHFDILTFLIVRLNQ